MFVSQMAFFAQVSDPAIGGTYMTLLNTITNFGKSDSSLSVSMSHVSGYPLHRGNRENGQKHSLTGKTQEIWKFCQNTRKLVCSSCKFPDSKGKRYLNICCKSFQISFEAGEVCQVSFVHVIVTNHVNWHRENLWSDRENKGKTQENAI